MQEKTKKTQYDIEYAKTNLKRIPLDVKLADFERIKAAAESAGESVNGYIKKAIELRMENNN